jgi:hypothetical protein
MMKATHQLLIVIGGITASFEVAEELGTLKSLHETDEGKNRGGS